MNIYLCIIVAALLLEFILYNLSRVLDLKNLSTKLPNEFKGYYDEEEYARSQKYLRNGIGPLTGSVDDTVKIGLGSVLQSTLDCQNLSGELVQRFVLRKTVLNPAIVLMGPAMSERFTIDSQQVSPFQGPEICVFRALQ